MTSTWGTTTMTAIHKENLGYSVGKGLGGWCIYRDRKFIEGPYPTEPIACARMDAKVRALGNPGRYGKHDYAVAPGKIVTAQSESKVLGEVVKELTMTHKLVKRGGCPTVILDMRLKTAIDLLNGLKRQAQAGIHRNAPRRSNSPILAVIGPNPVDKETKPIRATWGRIEYRRPDDPEGKRVVREHDFPDGFVASPMSDGSVLLRHPKGRRLWTRR